MPAGSLFGFLWFFMLFLAAITSSLSMLQPAIAFLEEGLNVGRRVSVTILGLITALGSLFVIYYSKDRVALDTMDDWVGTALMVLLATVEVLLFSWVFGVDKGMAFANEGAQMRLPRFFRLVISYVAPLYLLIVLGTWCYRVLPDKLSQLAENRVALMTLCIIGSVLIFFLLLTNIAGKRWNAEKRDTSPRSALPAQAEVGP
jgi:SNF family Na+-dependent transporter